VHREIGLHQATFGGKMPTILDLIYPQDQIFVSDPRYDDEALEMTVQCCVPETIQYTLNHMPYLSAENYVRILSQTSYLLGHHVITCGLLPVAIKSETFVNAAVNLQLYYRNVAMTFHKVVRKGDAFHMTLCLASFKEIKRLDDFIIFTFANKKTVIAGEMSFIYAPNAR
jgi:hypothetical protein